MNSLTQRVFLLLKNGLKFFKISKTVKWQKAYLQFPLA